MGCAGYRICDRLLSVQSSEYTRIAHRVVTNNNISEASETKENEVDINGQI